MDWQDKTKCGQGKDLTTLDQTNVPDPLDDDWFDRYVREADEDLKRLLADIGPEKWSTECCSMICACGPKCFCDREQCSCEPCSRMEAIDWSDYAD